jgi:hypothetical protein
VVRAEGTGATCLLSAVAGETLKALQQGATYVDEIAARVFADDALQSMATAALVATFAESAPATKDLLAILTELETQGLAQADLA